MNKLRECSQYVSVYGSHSSFHRLNFIEDIFILLKMILMKQTDRLTFMLETILKYILVEKL